MKYAEFTVYYVVYNGRIVYTQTFFIQQVVIIWTTLILVYIKITIRKL